MPTNPWEMDWTQAQPAAPSYPGVIPGRPQAVRPAEAERLEISREQLALQQAAADRAAAKDAREAAEDADKAGKRDNARLSAISSLRNVIDQIDEVAFDSADNSGWFETGRSGAFVRSMPTFMQAGSAAYDLAGNIKTIDANAAFNALAEMRQNSPTGGALGAITERELDLLRSSIANLDPNLSQETFFGNLADAKKVYIDMLSRLDPAAAEEIRAKPGIQFDDEGNALLVSVPGDNREPTDPMGVMPPDPPAGGDGGGGNVMFRGIPGLEGDYSAASLATGFGRGVGSLVEGFGDLLGIATNPVGQALYNAAGVNGRYDTGTIIREATGLPDNPDSVSDAATKAGSAALTGSLAARGLASMFNPGTAQAVLSTIGRTPVQDTVAGGAAGLGALAGRNSGVPGGEVAGALVGGLAGYGGANAAARATAPRVSSPVVEAAARQGIDLLPADVGGRGTKVVTSAARSSPFSASRVANAAGRSQEQLAAASRRVAGDPVDSDVAGEIIRGSAERYTRQTAERGSRLYDRAYAGAKGVKIKPLQTLAAIDEQIARLEQNPAAGSVLNDLRALRGKIEGGVSVQGLRDARTSLSQGVYDGKLRSGSDTAMMKSILANIADDIDAGLRNAGRDKSADQFRAADTFWRDRVEHIDQVLQPIIGRDGTKGGEQVVEAIESMARGKSGGNQRLSRLLGNMTEPEARQVRSAIVTRLGRARAGAQNAEGDAFSPATFLTNWNAMTPQAKASLFRDQQMRRDLDDIARIAAGTKASQALNNNSETASALMGSAQGNLAVQSPTSFILGAGAQYVTGRLMASPKFARIVARTSRMNPKAGARSFREQLAVLATREPLLANDIRSILAANDNALPMAASAQDEPDRPQE